MFLPIATGNPNPGLGSQHFLIALIAIGLVVFALSIRKSRLGLAMFYTGASITVASAIGRAYFLGLHYIANADLLMFDIVLLVGSFLMVCGILCALLIMWLTGGSFFALGSLLFGIPEETTHADNKPPYNGGSE